jgi:hypothetical protein
MGHAFNHRKRNRAELTRGVAKSRPPLGKPTREELRQQAEVAFKSGVAVTRVPAKPRRDPLETNSIAHQRVVARIYGVR